MAEASLGVVGMIGTRRLLEAAAGVVVETLRVPGARTPARLASWIEDTPELKLNLSLLAEAFLQLLASGLGTLALVWATVVLLGGFSTMLVTTDFWFTTAIVFVETARIVGYNSAPEAKFFVDLPATLSQKKISRAGTATKIIRRLTLGPTWIALTPVFLATACMSLSIIRLVGVARHDYGGGSTSTGGGSSTSSSSGDTRSNRNMKPALILFYALVLIQGALYLLWFVVAVIRSRLAVELNWCYLNTDTHLLRWRSRKQLIDRYVSSIADTCIEKGVATTINTNLVSFAAELLFQTQHPDDHTSAVLVLHSLVIKNRERSDRAVEQICSSGKLVYRLVRMLRSEDLDADIKENIVEIVAKLACKLRLADIPGAAHCISSLLDPHLKKKAAQTGRNYGFHFIGIECRSEIKPIFVHGLVILGELASDPENCREIYSTMDLVPKIIAPVSNGLHMVIKDDETAVQIVRESLRVLAKLTRGTGENSRKLCHELTTKKYGRTAENILWILSNSDDQDMRMLAVEILSRLTSDEPIMSKFTAELRRLLLGPQYSQLRIEAGKALIALGDEFPDIQQLVTVMSADAYSKEYRAVTAEMLARICAKSTADQDRINRLSSVANAQSSVLEAIVTETTDITWLDISNRKFLASFLGLAVQIREKLATAEAFADAVTGLPVGNNIIFAEKLMRIIEMTIKCRSADIDASLSLAIIKSATKLVTWMTEIDTISPGYYIDYFRQENIVRRLDTAVKAMVDLERYVVMTGGADEKEGYVTLHTLVETAKNKLVSQQQPQQQQN